MGSGSFFFFLEGEKTDFQKEIKNREKKKEW